MAYGLETVSQADQEKIFQDAAAFPDKKLWLDSLASVRLFPKRWAVDRARNCYLIWTPAVLPSEWNEEGYIAVVDGRMYLIKLTSVFGQDVYFDENSLPSGATLEALQSEVTAAFSVLGIFGTGPINEFGITEFDIVPVFREKGYQTFR